MTDKQLPLQAPDFATAGMQEESSRHAVLLLPAHHQPSSHLVFGRWCLRPARVRLQLFRSKVAVAMVSDAYLKLRLADVHLSKKHII